MTEKEKKELVEYIYVLKLQDDATAELNTKLLKSIVSDTVDEMSIVANIDLKIKF